jgi:hypothetical protein
MRSQLFQAYDGLASTYQPTQKISAAGLIPGRIGDYITLGSQGEPLLLLAFVGNAVLRPPVVLRHLSIEYGARYRIHTGSKDIDGIFVAISLRTHDTSLYEAFCLAGETLIASLPPSPSDSDIDNAVNHLVELLSAISVPSTRAIAGLWAELWLILKATDVASALQSWHNDATDRFDFTFDTHNVEIKATEKADRTHEFSLEQIRGATKPTRIASVKLQRNANGVSVADLVENIAAKLPPSGRSKLVRNVFKSIGEGVIESDEIRFDEKFAETHLRLIPAELVPAVAIPDGAPISSVRFRVNLDDASINASLVKGDSTQVFLR